MSDTDTQRINRIVLRLKWLGAGEQIDVVEFINDVRAVLERVAELEAQPVAWVLYHEFVGGEWRPASEPNFDKRRVEHQQKMYGGRIVPLYEHTAQQPADADTNGWDADAYAKMRDEIMWWKTKAERAEADLERIRHELSPTHMGEPVVPADADRRDALTHAAESALDHLEEYGDGDTLVANNLRAALRQSARSEGGES